MILIIHTADLKQVFLGLVENNKLVAKKIFSAQYHQAEKLLSAIDKMFKDSNRRLQNLKAIAVVSGPGPFTALRIGVATANTLAWALKIPVVGIKLSEFKNIDELVRVSSQRIKKAKAGTIIEPFYDQEPNITLKKKI